MVQKMMCLDDEVFFFSSRRRHTRFDCDWSSDVCSSDLADPRERDADARPHHMPLSTSPTIPAARINTGSGILDRKSTRLNSSHSQISYAGLCLQKKI